jgi:deoxycytidylate deaminase
MINTTIKQNFLILGFTGPLNSGCTTAAEFFVNKLEDEIQKYVSHSEQPKIEEIYKAISSLLDKHHLNKRILKRKKFELNELLRTREIKKVLSKEDIPQFHYISMSNMLLKYTVEYLLFNNIKRVNHKYQNIIEFIKKEDFDKKVIKRINSKIENKEYQKITKDECKFYDDYLDKLNNLMTRIKNTIKSEALGDILQDLGDNIRKHGNPFQVDGDINSDCVSLLAEQANKIIKFFRNRQDDESKRRDHFVIECFRNPYEVEYFRYRYYEFYLFSIFAEEKERQKRGNFSKKRDSRDRGEGIKLHEIYKQNVSRCVYLSDIAINNDSSKEDFYKKLMRYYALILSPGCITPTTQETFMNQAYSLSLRSSCISRQVGAVIIGKNGYVIGAGWNDAGKGQVGCGYRQVIDIKNLPNEILPTNPITEDSFRRYLTRTKGKNELFCYKDEYSLYILRTKFKSFMRQRKEAFDKLGTKEEQRKMIEDWLSKDIKIKRLEYCRALHAEENALLQTSKIGGMGVKGGVIYTTSFPCELCAKKIYQAGIKEIIYTEPYPASISQEVFLKDGIRKIKLTQFEGVKSHSYFRLFKASMDKKEMQALVKIEGTKRKA